jgi:hypothetical protein
VWWKNHMLTFNYDLLLLFLLSWPDPIILNSAILIFLCSYSPRFRRTPHCWFGTFTKKVVDKQHKHGLIFFGVLNWVWAIIKGPYDSINLNPCIFRSGLGRRTIQKQNYSWLKMNCLLRSVGYDHIISTDTCRFLQRGYWSSSLSQLQEYIISNF